MTPQAAHTASSPSKWVVFAIVAGGVFMATLDSSIVNVSLPTIASYFGVPLGPEVEWLIIAYLVMVAALLLTVGRLADLYGRKAIWATGLIIFTAGSAICGAAPSLPFLIGARALQGIGGAFLMAISPALLTSAFPPDQRGRAIGLNAVVVATGISAGPTLGGLITANLSWRWIFYLNLPIGAVGLLATLKVLPSGERGARGRFDPLGAMLLATGLASLTGGMSVGNDVGWLSAPPLVLGGIALVSIVFFLLHERRHPHPVVDLSLFENRVFSSASASLVLSFLASFAVSFLLPFYLEQLRGFDTETTGLLLTPYPLMLGLIAPVSGALSDFIGSRWLAAAGMALLCVALLLLAQLGVTSSKVEIIWKLLLAGAGAGIFQSPNNSALLGAAPKHRQGIASGTLATGRVVGQSLSVALGGAVFTTLGGAAAGRALAGGAAAAQRAALQATFVNSFRWSLRVCAALAAVAIVTSLVRGREKTAQDATKPAH